MLSFTEGPGLTSVCCLQFSVLQDEGIEVHKSVLILFLLCSLEEVQWGAVHPWQGVGSGVHRVLHYLVRSVVN